MNGGIKGGEAGKKTQGTKPEKRGTRVVFRGTSGQKHATKPVLRVTKKERGAGCQPRKSTKMH